MKKPVTESYRLPVSSCPHTDLFDRFHALLNSVLPTDRLQDFLLQIDKKDAGISAGILIFFRYRMFT